MGAGVLAPVEIKKSELYFLWDGMCYVMRESIVLCFLYKTVFGRMVLKFLVQPGVSHITGKFLSSSLSRWLVPYYIWKHKIDMDDIEIPPKGFSSFNDFFIRNRRIECCDLTRGHLISPCDGLLTHIRIKKDFVFEIKNTRFYLEDLLEDHKLAKAFQNGAALIFRLSAADYHRYCYMANGRIRYFKKIQGKLHCVRPIALRTVPVFVQNSREYQVIETEQFGTMIQMEIGALLVGKIKNYRQPLDQGDVRAGEEKGYFEFGGSTILVLLKENAIYFNEKLYERQNSDGEIPVDMGECVAKTKKGRRLCNES